MPSKVELENRVAELYAALENLLDTSAVITDPAHIDGPFVDLQCGKDEYEAAYAALAKSRPASLPPLPND